MFLFAGGLSKFNQGGIEPTTVAKFNLGCVDTVTRVPFDLVGVQCISGGNNHSVIIKLGSVFAAGNDEEFRIGSDSRQVYKAFTEIKISEESISWAACGERFTLYLTVSGKAILCHEKAKGEQIHVKLAKKAVSVFAGIHYGGIIDEEGAIHILDKDPRKPPRRFSFESPAIDLACCQHFVCALTSDGRVFANGKLNKGSQDFAEVSSLKGKKIEKLSGYRDTCAALTSDGRVFICGENEYGQFGNGTTRDDYNFTEVRMNEVIKDVSCSWHTLFLTESNKTLGCGNNEYCQLFMKTEDEYYLSPIEITRIRADQVIACQNHSFIMTGTGKLENPAKKYFGFLKKDPMKIEEQATSSPKRNQNVLDLLLVKVGEQSEKIIQQEEKINTLVSLCQSQAQTINQLMKICETQSMRIDQLNKDHQSQDQKMNEIDNKLGVVVKYINDLDVF